MAVDRIATVGTFGPWTRQRRDLRSVAISSSLLPKTAPWASKAIVRDTIKWCV